jgi:hypothetical protein
MSLRCRRFLIADDGTLYRLANARFDRMLRDPASYPLPASRDNACVWPNSGLEFYVAAVGDITLPAKCGRSSR